jgi:hypothetical protein
MQKRGCTHLRTRSAPFGGLPAFIRPKHCFVVEREGLRVCIFLFLGSGLGLGLGSGLGLVPHLLPRWSRERGGVMIRVCVFLFLGLSGFERTKIRMISTWLVPKPLDT